MLIGLKIYPFMRPSQGRSVYIYWLIKVINKIKHNINITTVWQSVSAMQYHTSLKQHQLECCVIDNY